MLASLVAGLDPKGDEAAAAPLVLLQDPPRAGESIPGAYRTEPADLALGERRLTAGRLGLFQRDESLAFRDLFPQQGCVGEHHRRHRDKLAAILGGPPGQFVPWIGILRHTCVCGDVLSGQRDDRGSAVLTGLHRIIVPEILLKFLHRTVLPLLPVPAGHPVNRPMTSSANAQALQYYAIPEVD